MKLLFANPSPYSAKVRLSAALAGIEIEAVPTATADEPAELLDANPLGKIPTLILEDGFALYDSRAIVREIDRRSPGTLFPTGDGAARRETERLESLGDGLCDCMLAIVYDRRTRPEDKWHLPYQEKQWEKVSRGLDWLDRTVDEREGRAIDAGTISLLSALGYADLRHPRRRWRASRHVLAAEFDRLTTAIPDWEALKPQ